MQCLHERSTALAMRPSTAMRPALVQEALGLEACIYAVSSRALHSPSYEALYIHCYDASTAMRPSSYEALAMRPSSYEALYSA